jgi:hypothetical protein
MIIDAVLLARYPFTRSPSLSLSFFALANKCIARPPARSLARSLATLFTVSIPSYSPLSLSVMRVGVSVTDCHRGTHSHSHLRPPGPSVWAGPLPGRVRLSGPGRSESVSESVARVTPSRPGEARDAAAPARAARGPDPPAGALRVAAVAPRQHCRGRTAHARTHELRRHTRIRARAPTPHIHTYTRTQKHAYAPAYAHTPAHTHARTRANTRTRRKEARTKAGKRTRAQTAYSHAESIEAVHT